MTLCTSRRAGLFALWLMSSVEAALGACYALEPAAPSFELLQENLRAAGLQEKVWLLPFRQNQSSAIPYMLQLAPLG